MNPRHALVSLLSLLPVLALAQPSELALDLAVEASHPRLAAGPDGSAHLIFEGRLPEGNAVISHRVWRGGAWSGDEILSASSTGLYDPQIAVSPDGAVHAVWSTDSPAQVIYAVERAGAWSAPIALSGGLSGASEFPSLAATGEGGAEVAWQTLVGTQFQVAHASVSPDGTPSPAQVLDQQSSQRANCYPQCFLTPVPVIAWYEAIDGNLMLRAAEAIPGDAWRRITIDDLLQADLNRVPYLLMSDLGTWAALWHDAAPDQDRILLGRGGESDFGLGAIVDSNPGFDNVAPSAASLGDDSWAVVWRGEAPSEPDIFLALETTEGWLQENLSLGFTPAPADPAICIAGGEIVVVWASDAKAGGSGRLVGDTIPLE